MDISETLAPKSDQLDYDDFLAGDRTFTIKEVRRGPSPEQPVEILMAEFERPWRPAKSMRRVLVAAWEADASKYVGKRIALFGDPDVRFGGQAVGGIRIRALSGIDKPLSVSLTVTRGRRAPFIVQPLPDEPEPKPAGEDVLLEFIAALHDAPTSDHLRSVWEDAAKRGLTSNPRIIAAKDKRKSEL